ncbi:MAG: T9SS type A sorting domain-containing protein [Bacteroidetes bacterium]|nr:T9SS type A sorting domain-containing protein [Bacteroidota bacterium]
MSNFYKAQALLLFNIVFSSLAIAQVNSWNSKGIGSGGAVQNAAISPFDGNRVFMSCDMSQMFETKDFGDNWQSLNFTNLQGGIRGKVGFTNDAQKLYAVGSNSSGAYLPKKSVDGGSTWTTLSPNPCVNFGAFQLYTNLNDYHQFVLSDKANIYFTKDAGASFSTIETDNSSNGVHLAGAFFDGLNIYIASNKKIFISSDGGKTFPTVVVNSSANISASEGVVSFTGAKQGSITKFFCTTISSSVLNCKTYGFDVQSFVGLYTIENPFSSWTNITANLNASNINDTEKAYYVAMLPNDTNHIYLGGSVLSNGATYGTVYKSTNSGSTWNNVFLNSTPAANNNNISTGWFGACSSPNYSHVWSAINTTEGLCIDPNNINRIIMTNKSNVHYSLDGGATWTQMYVKAADAHAANAKFASSSSYATTGLETLVTYWLTWIDQSNMIASCADVTAIKSSDAGNKWNYNYSNTNIYAGGNLKINDISMLVKDPKTGILYAATGDVVGSNGVWDDSRLSLSHGRICFSADNGSTWQILHDFDRPVTFLHFDKNHPDSLYACVQDIAGGNIGGIYRCNSVAKGSSSVWTKLNAPARASNRPNNIYVLSNGDLISAYYPFDSTSNYNYAAKSGVFYSNDGGSTWKDRTHTNMQQKTYNIIPDPNDPNEKTWLACVGAGGPSNSSGLYRTDDLGVSWTNITPGQSTLSCTFHPYLANEMYVCTELNGLYYAKNTNSFSFTPSQVSSYDFRSPQRVFFNPYDINEVWVTSFGNGLKVGTTNIATSVNHALVANNLYAAYPNPVQDIISFNLNGEKLQSISIYNATGQLVMVQHDSQFSVESLANGIYLVVVNANDKVVTSKFLKQ